jgi:hypothetical protein
VAKIRLKDLGHQKPYTVIVTTGATTPRQSPDNPSPVTRSKASDGANEEPRGSKASEERPRN